MLFSGLNINSRKLQEEIMSMDRQQFFHPPPAVQTQFFPPPNVAFAPAFPPLSFHVPPPVVPCQFAEPHHIFDTSIESFITGRRNEIAVDETENLAPPIKVHEFSQRVKDFYSSLSRLKSLLERYKLHQNDVSDAKLDLRAKILTEQECLSQLKASMGIYSENIQLLKEKISKRRRKRRKKFICPVGFNAHQIAADHMQRLLRIAIDVEQDEKLKKDADNILSDVLRKKNEACQSIRLLSALEKLHTARCNSIGTSSRNSGFIAVIEKLKISWEARLQEYAVEESGFRVMIDELAMDRKKESNENRDKIFGEWCKSIFGVSDSRFFMHYANVDDLIRIRHNWDKYVVEDSDVSSKIPPGWVLPENRCDDSGWGQFICK